ncbi:hypothetical protein [Hymenobacter sp. CRA2]|uniref:hypothetical protein n=1 Tax=Hymenobacter sp. CRA2 TaxID=1955620 RepID=UPI00098F1594|nr:hypothetical protein [Hymenobacter sp. CRA2]OON68449.1 hypothetical protein B0919_12410 [Hymenobacter sp. CRA2]
MNPAAPASQQHIVLHHKRQARMARAKSLSHLVPAGMLVTGVVGVLTKAEPLTPLLVVEFVVGAAYLVLLLRELRHLRHDPHHHERVAWLELAAAGIAALEGYHIWHRHHEAELGGAPARIHVLPYLYALIAAIYVWLAFNSQRLQQRRFLHLHEDGFTGRLHPFSRRFDYRWEELTGVEPVGAAELLVRHRDGRERRLSFDQMHEGATLREQVLAHAIANRLMKSEE